MSVVLSGSRHPAVDVTLNDLTLDTDLVGLRERSMIAVMRFCNWVDFQTQIPFAFVDCKGDCANNRYAQYVKNPIHSKNMGAPARSCKLGATSC